MKGTTTPHGYAQPTLATQKTEGTYQQNYVEVSVVVCLKYSCANK